MNSEILMILGLVVIQFRVLTRYLPGLTWKEHNKIQFRFEPATSRIRRLKSYGYTVFPSLGKSAPVTGLGVAQRVGRGIVLLFHDRGTRRG